MSDSVHVRLGYGFNLGWGMKVPKDWEKWDGVQNYMGLMDYFDSFPGVPAVEVTYSGNCYADDMQDHIMMSASIKSADYGDPIILKVEEMEVPPEWNERLLEVAKAMVVDVTEKDLTWLVASLYG